VRSGPGEARTIPLLHIISVRPSKQPLMVRTFLKVYMELGSTEEAARTPSRAGSMASSVFSDRTAGSSYATEALSAEMKAKLVKIILYRKMTGTMSKNSVQNGELLARWLPAAGGEGSGPMRMCGNIFAAARLCRGSLLTTGRLLLPSNCRVCGTGRGGRCGGVVGSAG
jgi:hypothetical protein